MSVVRENVIAGEELKNQHHPDRSSVVGAYEEKCMQHCYVTWALEELLKYQTEFSVGTPRISLYPFSPSLLISINFFNNTHRFHLQYWW
jgi:hypothetical protein